MAHKEPLIEEITLNNFQNPQKELGFTNKDPFKETTCFGRFFFNWAFHIISLSKKTILTTSHLGKFSSEYQSKTFFSKINSIWNNKGYKHSPSFALFKTVIRDNLSSLIFALICSFFINCLTILSIHFFRMLISVFSDKSSLTKTHIYIGIYYLSTRLAQFLFEGKTLELLNYIGNKAAAGVTCLIYDKLLNVSSSCVIKSGDIFNYLQSDCHKLTVLMTMSPNIFTVPFMIIMYNYLLFKYMGIAFIYGFAVMIMFLGLNYYFRKKFSFYLKLHMKMNDKRMRVCSETFNNLKVIKLYGWDDSFLEKIQGAREEELKALEKRYQITQVSQTLLWLAPIAMSVAAIGAYQYMHETFNISNMFTCLGIFTSIQTPMQMLPVTIDMIIETLNSLRRIEKFLKLPEIDKYFIKRNEKDTIQRKIAVKIENGNFIWGEKKKEQKTRKEDSNSNSVPTKKKNEIIELSNVSSSNKNLDNRGNSYKKIINDDISIQTSITDISDDYNKAVLKNINLEIKNGEFVCIIGEIGSGKSSLVHAILNNMKTLSPKSTKIIINGNISYVGQESWIQNTTVKNNILFNHPYDEEKYNKIIHLCELKKDFDILIGGDMTEIGEKGVNLSGGQKARIAIARAMYTDKDIFIFDDPISALDADVGKNIIMNCVIDHLKNKTRILITHALQYLSYADRIIYLQNGEIKWSGNYQELTKQEFYSSFLNKVNQLQNSKDKNGHNNKSKNSISEKNGNTITKTNDQIKKITKEEDKAIGTIDKAVYFTYFKYIGGICLIVILLIVLISWQGFKIASDMWLGYWSKNQKEENKRKFYFTIFAALALGSTLFNYGKVLVVTKGSLKCSTRLHQEMIKSLISAPINLFHDTTPKGQIFNRLSKDLPTVDTYTMFWLLTSVSFGSSFLGGVVVSSYLQPYSLLFLPFFLGLCWYVCRFYMNCSRELTRMEGILNSPILNIINETIPGTTTIRAYNFEDKYLSTFQSKVDEHFKVAIYLVGTNQWYLLIVNFLSFLYLSLIITFALIYKERFSPDDIGILLSYSLVLQTNLIQFLNSFSNFENTMTKMERSLAYTKLISEAPQVKDSDDSHGSWPDKGKIEFIDYTVKYRPDTDIVLDHISFTVNPGEHLGIVGRTGSGKSTITLCLFRILEALCGNILIDNVDIGNLGLKKLRTSLTIIPQNATLMTGTLRYNIDPLNLFSDSDIIYVMNQIGFNYIIENNPKGLEQSVMENGENLSNGEKQLLCITRAILRKSKIVIMDEATACIDYKTEEIVQKGINELLKYSTLITIAHRIKTVINSDKIMVLDNGKIVEFDTPKKLLENKQSIFYDYYSKSLL